MRSRQIILAILMLTAVTALAPARASVITEPSEIYAEVTTQSIDYMGTYNPVDQTVDQVMQTATGHSAEQATLVYGGGNIQKSTQFYICYWGYTSDPSGVRNYANAFFNGVGGSSWIATDNQYYSNSQGNILNPTGQLKGTWDDTTSIPNHLRQADINNAGVRCMNHFGYNADATYSVATPTGHSQSGFGTQWCAYHESLTVNGKATAVAYLPYTPDAGASCGKNFVNGGSAGNNDGVSITWGHEFEEAKSDPKPCTGWCTTGGSENADECAWKKPPAANIVLSTGTFAVQGLWSNAAGGCVIGS